jgi:predicted SAM-dependent methyltransferase
MTLKNQVGKALIPLLPINRRTFDILRFEFGNIFQRLKNFLNPAYHFKISKLRKLNDIQLNVGSGGRGLDNWINIDIRPTHQDIYIAHDIRRKLPLRDNSTRLIFAEHVIEHVDFKNDLPAILSDFYRILQKKGAIRIIVPNAERFLEAYVQKDPRKWQALNWNLEKLPYDIHTPMHVINHVYHQDGEHLFGYDFMSAKSWNNHIENQ